jgi:hypothetical protein
MICYDWLERKTEELLARARATGFFNDVIMDARCFRQHDGYTWDCSLALALSYWER